jgi:di/tricarboxylate transporter
MTTQAWLLVAILVMMFGLLIWGKLPTWLVFILTLTAVMTLKLAPLEDLLSGFSNPGVITVAALFPIAAGMYSTGAITIATNVLIGLPDKLRQAQIRIFPPVAGASAFLNNTPLVAMMIPVVKDLSQRTGIAATRLFMPMSFSSILGGASTLIGTSTNLILAGLIVAAGLPTLNIFAPSLVGIPAALIGIAFLMTIGTRLLPEGQQEEDSSEKRLYKAEFLIADNSPLIGKTILESGLSQAKGSQLVDFVSADEDSKIPDHQPGISGKQGLFHRLTRIWRAKSGKTVPSPDIPEMQIDLYQDLQAGDILTFISDNQALTSLWITIGIKPATGLTEGTKRYTHHLVEVVVAPSHPAAGRYISELPIREDPPYTGEIVAISRDNMPPDPPIRDFRIQGGDVAVLEVEDDFFYQTRNQHDFSLTRQMDGYRIKRTSRAAIAGIIIITMILLAAFNVISMLNAALLGGLALLLTGSMTPRTGWQSIEWDTVVILGAAVGISTAVTATGLSDVIAQAITAIGGTKPYIALVMVFLGCILMTNIITNAAAASIMFPVALSLSISLGVSFTPFAVVLMLGTSYAFINPAGYQTNLMVQEPGNYTFSDFAKVGIPLTILVGAIVLILTPLLYQF